MKVSPGIGGRGTAVSIESKRHPKSHFEMHEMRIKKADDGSYVIHHEMRLKKKHENRENFYGGHMEGETHTAQNPKELMAHIQQHMGKGAMTPAANPEAEPDADDAA